MTAPATRVLPAGDRALLVELADLDAALSLSAELRRRPLPRQLEVVPAARTVLLRFDAGSLPQAELEERLAAWRVGPVRDAHPRAAEAEEPVVITVDYDGEDLAEVARLTGLDPEEVVRRHTAADYRVAFAGFAPGFAYLAGGDPALTVPRRRSPRTRIPAGAVAIAGEFSGIYPRSSPGGWQLLGRTDARLWDPSRAEPALLRPGARVRFIAGRLPADTDGADADREPGPTEASTAPDPQLQLLGTALLTTVQDDGRAGHAAIGVPPSGAVDRPALHRANRAVGNAPGAAAIEFAAGALTLRARVDAVLAVSGSSLGLSIVVGDPAAGDGTGDAEITGIDVTDASHADAVLHPPGVPVAVPAGAVVRVHPADRGRYGYLAVRGGVEAAAVLGSAATDTLSGLGPQRLDAGAGLRIAAAPMSGLRPVDRQLEPPLPAADVVVTVRAVLGPRDDWFDTDAVAALGEQLFTVTSASDRVGIRLDGAQPLHRRPEAPAELPSEGMVAGMLQVPPDGQPVLFLADHPVTGGYPVIATLDAAEVARAAQVPIGGMLRLALRRAHGAAARR